MSENLGQLAINQARENGGKLEVISKVKVEDKRDLSIAYTQGWRQYHQLLQRMWSLHMS